MPFYVRPLGGKPQQRVFLDTAKAYLDYEGERYDLTGATLDLYDGRWQVIDGFMGEEGREPAKILRLEDPFTGLKVEVPLRREAWVALSAALLDEPPRRRLWRRGRVAAPV